MVEEKEVEKTNETADALVSDAEFKSIEKEIMQKDSDAKEALKKEVEASVRKELEAEQKLKSLEEQNKKMEELVKQKLNEKEALEKKYQEELEKVKSQIGSSKAVIQPNSPFQSKPENTKPLDFENMTREQLNEADEASKEAFKEFLKEKGNSMKGLDDW